MKLDLLSFFSGLCQSLKQKLYQFTKRSPYLASCIAFVLIMHLSFFVYSLMAKASKKIPIHRKLAIKTYTMPKAESKEILKVKEVAKATQKPKTSIKKPKPVSKKTKPTTKKRPVKKAPDKRKKLLKELEKSIANIETSKQASTSSFNKVSVPKPITELKADSYEIKPLEQETEEAASEYTHLLVSHLKNTLALPGYGSVKIKLTINCLGGVEALTVCSSDSEVNRMYLEKHLKDLTFPSFTKELSFKKSHTFTLTFCSR